MFEYMENVSPNEAENIRKTIQDLLRQTCILQMKCDPVTLIQRDTPTTTVVEKIAFLMRIWSAIAPQTGPISADTTVITAIAIA